MENRYEKFTKQINFGEMTFNVAITRKIAVELYKAHPEILRLMDEVKERSEKINREKAQTKGERELTNEEIIEYEDMAIRISEAQAEIAKAALPKILACYDDVTEKEKQEEAAKILEYASDNDILYDYADEEDENAEVIKGLYSYIFEFVSMGFSNGVRTPSKKPKVQITIN